MIKHKDGFEVFQGGAVNEGNLWYWRLCRRGRVVADGAEGYASKTNVMRAVRGVKKWLKTSADVTVVTRDKKR